MEKSLGFEVSPFPSFKASAPFSHVQVAAMFAYLASGDWRELLDESGLALRDRCAIALRFLADSEVRPPVILGLPKSVIFCLRVVR